MRMFTVHVFQGYYFSKKFIFLNQRGLDQLQSTRLRRVSRCAFVAPTPVRGISVRSPLNEQTVNLSVEPAVVRLTLVCGPNANLTTEPFLGSMRQRSVSYCRGEKRMKANDKIAILASLHSCECPACGWYKRPFASFCPACYAKLPVDAKEALCSRFGRGYEEGFCEALELSGVNEENNERN